MATQDGFKRVDVLERDLGFGAVVSRESGQRLLNRDGTFNVHREGIGFWQTLNLYHALLSISWPMFFGLVFGFYCVANGLFAFVYLACGPEALLGDVGVGSSFLRAFLFSVETSSTIGYGNLVVTGLPANLVMVAEVLFAIVSFAVITGVVFARFSRPVAHIVFSDRAVLTPFQGGQAFMFRVVNARNNQIIELKAAVIFTRFEEKEGVRMRQYYTLGLERPSVAFFPLSWTVVHAIDETSPLHGVSEQELKQSRAEFLILLSGTDETSSERVHARSSYVADEVVWNARFASVFVPPGPGKKVTIDLARFHLVEPLE
ncbi:MAG: ion channel [Acidobacteriota bacterium]|nr:ion channel [Acidobacteriota bacterium]